MSQGEDDHIDKGSWIPPDSPIFPCDKDGTPYRANKGGDMMVAVVCPECGGRPDTCKLCKHCRTRGMILVENNGQVPMKEAIYVQYLERNLMNWLWERDVLDDQNLHDGQTYERWQMIYRAKRGRGVHSQALHGITDAEAGSSEVGFSLIIQKLAKNYQHTIENAFMMANEHTRWLTWRNRHVYYNAFQALTRLMPTIHKDIKKLLDQRKKEAHNVRIEGGIIAP